jgi:hypothetical protein
VHLSNISKTQASQEKTYNLHNPLSSGDQKAVLFPEVFNASGEAAAKAGVESHHENVDDSIVLDLGEQQASYQI